MHSLIFYCKQRILDIVPLAHSKIEKILKLNISDASKLGRSVVIRLIFLSVAIRVTAISCFLVPDNISFNMILSLVLLASNW